MGLDMYLFKRKKNAAEGDESIELGYWRKHPRLHLYMENLWEERNPRSGEIFNCVELPLNKEDIYQAIDFCQEELKNFNEENEREGLGYFFGNTCKEDWEYSIKILEEALNGVDFENEELLYDSWW